MARSKKPPIGDPETGAIQANEVPAEPIQIQEKRGKPRTRQARTVPVTGYDAKGEAVDYEAPLAAASDKGQEQGALPGLPAPRELWPRFDGYRVTKVALAFSGVCDLTQDAELAKQIAMGGRFTVVVTGEVVGRAFKFNPTKSGEARTLMGTATLGVTDIHDLAAPTRAKARIEGTWEPPTPVAESPAESSPSSAETPEPAEADAQDVPVDFAELLCLSCGHVPHADVCDEESCGCSEYVPEPATFAEYLAQMRAAAGSDERTTPCARCGDMKVAHYGKCRSTKDGGSTCSCPGFAPDAEGF